MAHGELLVCKAQLLCIIVKFFSKIPVQWELNFILHRYIDKDEPIFPQNLQFVIQGGCESFINFIKPFFKNYQISQNTVYSFYHILVIGKCLQLIIAKMANSGFHKYIC